MATKKTTRKAETASTGTISRIGQRRNDARGGATPDYEQRRRAVLDAATEVFRKNGYQATKLAEVSARLGGDRATLYYYFSGKQDLFRALVFDAVLANTVRAEEIRDMPLPPLDRLETIVREAVLSFERYPALSVFALEDNRTLEGERGFDDLLDLNRRYSSAVHSVLAEAAADGTVDPQSTRAATILIMGILNWANRWYRPGRDMDDVDLADMASTLVRRGLAADASTLPDQHGR